MLRKLRGRLSRGEEGFSLVETVVALTIAGIAFSTLALALISGVHTSLLSQQNQQAGDLLSQTVEQARQLGYDGLAMRATDLNTGEAARTPTLASCNCYNPKTDGTSGTGVEPLATDPAGGVATHVTTLAQNGLTYTIRQYVTVPVDASGGVYKRFTSVVGWSALGKSHTRTYTTLMTPTRRGLPLPDYKFTHEGGLTLCRNPGSDALYLFNVQNNGARDAWNVTATGGGTWSFYVDTNGNSVYDSGIDQSMSSSGTATTGPIEPTASTSFFARAEIPALTPAPYTYATTFRVTSAAQSTYFSDLATLTSVQAGPCGGGPTATPSATTSPTATATATPSAPPQPAASCSSMQSASPNAPGGTMVRYYTHNPSQPGNTDASVGMPIFKDLGTPPPFGNLYSYSQNLSASAGRYLEHGSTTAGRHVASWTYQMPAASTLKGSGSITLWAATADGSTTARPVFNVTMELLNATGGALAGYTPQTASYTTPTSGWGCAGFRPVSLNLGSWTGSGTTIPANGRFRVSVRLATSSTAVLLAYGTQAYPAELRLPISAGNG